MARRTGSKQSQSSTIYNKGTAVAASGGDITPYIIAMIGVLIVVALPIGLLQAVANA